jgi:hypothetical protein
MLTIKIKKKVLRSSIFLILFNLKKCRFSSITPGKLNNTFIIFFHQNYSLTVCIKKIIKKNRSVYHLHHLKNISIISTNFKSKKSKKAQPKWNAHTHSSLNRVCKAHKAKFCEHTFNNTLCVLCLCVRVSWNFCYIFFGETHQKRTKLK